MRTMFKNLTVCGGYSVAIVGKSCKCHIKIWDYLNKYDRRPSRLSRTWMNTRHRCTIEQIIYQRSLCTTNLKYEHRKEIVVNFQHFWWANNRPETAELPAEHLHLRSAWHGVFPLLCCVLSLTLCICSILGSVERAAVLLLSFHAVHFQLFRIISKEERTWNLQQQYNHLTGNFSLCTYKYKNHC